MRTTNFKYAKQIRKLVQVFFIISILSACQNKTEQTLTTYCWEIKKIVDLESNALNQTKKENSKIWNFDSDKTYTYKTIKNNTHNLTKGNWILDKNKLFIVNEFDSTHLTIEKIDTENMVWLISKTDSIRVFLNSRKKEIVVPNFPMSN